ncbi:MAG: flagellar motor switch protein FliM [Candidatus Zixiibacteriota bacterium]
MAKILTQEEIDALLATVADGGPDTTTGNPDDNRLRSITTYDFRHPNRVSKDQIRTLENIHDNFGGQYGSSLSAMLRTVVDVDLVSVDQITYSEFIVSLVAPSCTYTFAAPPLEGVCLMDFNPTLTFSLIDRIFGGNGKLMETDRELTGIERSVMGKLAAKLYRDLERTWENIVRMEIEQKSLETNPQFIQIVPPGETVTVVSFQVKVLQSTGLLTLCYPYVSLEPIMGKLSAQNWIDATKRKNQAADREKNLQNLSGVEVEVSAVLLHTVLKMRDFLNLKPGDVIPSEKRIEWPLDIYVNRRRKYLGRPGLSGRKRAVQLIGESHKSVEEKK